MNVTTATKRRTPELQFLLFPPRQHKGRDYRRDKDAFRARDLRTEPADQG